VISIPPKFRNGQTAEFIPKIRQIIKTVQNHKIHKVIYISSTGVYSEGNTEVTELTPPNPSDESGKLLLQAEELFRQQTSFQISIIRFGGLVGPGRNPGRFFAGKKAIANGLAPVNLIHQSDAVGVTLAVIEKDAFGFTFNACSPHHPPKSEFYANAARQSGFDLPEFIPELKDWKIVSSKNIQELLQYQYQFTDWHTCMFD
jgi:nucleoside-diphosphate-sugar epimerase